MPPSTDEPAPGGRDSEFDLGLGRDAFLHHVKHEVSELVDEMLLTLSTHPELEIDGDLARLMGSMDELLRLYQSRETSVPARTETLPDCAGKPIGA